MKIECKSCLNRELIFVFGSNEAGIHGAGAALHARIEHAARIGQGFGYCGYSFAIPTKDHRIRTLKLTIIEAYVERFIDFAIDRNELKFNVTRIGCGLDGYTDNDIAPLFKFAPDNCILPDGWRVYSV